MCGGWIELSSLVGIAGQISVSNKSTSYFRLVMGVTSSYFQPSLARKWIDTLSLHLNLFSLKSSSNILDEYLKFGGNQFLHDQEA